MKYGRYSIDGACIVFIIYFHLFLYIQFNFVGKLLGPKGNTLRRLEQEVNCKIIIRGRGSTRNFDREEELRNSGDPRHAHLNKSPFVEISAVATPAECYARMAHALSEVRKYLVPDNNDEISQQQKLEAKQLNPDAAVAVK